MAPEKKTELPLQLMRRKTIKTIAIVVSVFGLVSAFLIWQFADRSFGASYFLGALLGIVNGAIGFVTIEKFIDRSAIVFLKGVFLGMGVRLVLLLGVFVLLIKVAHVHIAGLVSGLFVFYFTMTVLEVIFLNKRIELRKATKESKQ